MFTASHYIIVHGWQYHRYHRKRSYDCPFLRTKEGRSSCRLSEIFAASNSSLLILRGGYFWFKASLAEQVRCFVSTKNWARLKGDLN